MINQADVLRLKFEQELNEHLQGYFCTIDLTWEVRSEQQVVSCTFSLPETSVIESVIDILKQSEMFTAVSLVQSRVEQDKWRICIKTESVTDLVDQFRHAQYFNALLKVLPVSGILCTPSSKRDQLTIQICATKNSFHHVPKLLDLLMISWKVASSSKIVIPCHEVCSLIAQQKKLCLDYLIQTIQAIDTSIRVYGEGINTSYLASGRDSVHLYFSDNYWLTTPAIIFEFKSNQQTHSKLAALDPELFEFKVSGYYDNEPMVPCGIIVNRIVDIPFIIKDMTLPVIRQSRSNYLDTLLTFKGKTKEYGFSNLPYDISKSILLQVCDDSTLLSKDEISKHIDKISSYSL